MKPDLNFSYLTKYVHGYLHEKTSITKRSRLSVALRDHNGVEPNLKLHMNSFREIFSNLLILDYKAIVAKSERCTVLIRLLKCVNVMICLHIFPIVLFQEKVWS